MCGHGSRAGFIGRRASGKLYETGGHQTIKPLALADWLAGGCASLPSVRVSTALQRLGMGPRMELFAMWI